MFKFLVIAMLMASCSSQQEQEELPPENSASANETLNAAPNQSAEALGASANNSTKDEFANNGKDSSTNGAPISNPSGNLGGKNPAGGSNLFGGNAAVPTNATANTTPGSPNAATGNTNSNGATTEVAKENAKPQMEGKEYSNPHMNWPGRGKVKYIRGRSARHAAPGGAVVGQYDKGDHPLVMKEGDWAELSDGTYMPSSELSEQGIGRDKN